MAHFDDDPGRIGSSLRHLISAPSTTDAQGRIRAPLEQRKGLPLPLPDGLPGALAPTIKRELEALDDERRRSQGGDLDPEHTALVVVREQLRKRRKGQTLPPEDQPETTAASLLVPRANRTTLDRVERAHARQVFQLEPDGPDAVEAARSALEPAMAPLTDVSLEKTGFLPSHVRELVPQEKRDFWKAAFARSEPDLAELLPYRIQVMYRIVREIAVLRGWVADDETLNQALPTHVDPWKEAPTEDTRKREGTGWYGRRILEDLNKKIVAAQATEGVVTYGCPLLPPPVPKAYRLYGTDGGWTINTMYDPKVERVDPCLHVWMSVMKQIVSGLGIYRGSLREPTLGDLGLRGIYEPELVRLLCPTPMQILTWEELLVQEATSFLVQDGTAVATTRLKNAHGFSDQEAASFVKIAKGRARDTMEGDLEQDRAVMLMRLDDYVQRARSALDLRAEMAAMKQMTLVLGLGRTDPEDVLKEFVGVVKNVAASRPKISASSIVDVEARLLPTPPSEEAEEDDDDE